MTFESSAIFAKPMSGDDSDEIKLARETRMWFWRKPFCSVSAARMNFLACGPSIRQHRPFVGHLSPPSDYQQRNRLVNSAAIQMLQARLAFTRRS